MNYRQPKKNPGDQVDSIVGSSSRQGAIQPNSIRSTIEDPLRQETVQLEPVSSALGLSWAGSRT